MCVCVCVLEQYVIEGIEFLRELRVKKEIEREDFAAELEAMQKVVGATVFLPFIHPIHL